MTITIETLLALLKAGAALAGQESVKLATKQAYEALRRKLTQVLGKPTVEAAEAGNIDGLPTGSIRQKLLALDATEKEQLAEALRTIVSDTAVEASVPGRLRATLRDARINGIVVIEAGEHIRDLNFDGGGMEANGVHISAKKN